MNWIERLKKTEFWGILFVGAIVFGVWSIVIGGAIITAGNVANELYLIAKTEKMINERKIVLTQDQYEDLMNVRVRCQVCEKELEEARKHIRTIDWGYNLTE